jgi:hypothetical protein
MKCGIFDACPGKMLHLILLSWFKYLLEAIASQASSTSVAFILFVGPHGLYADQYRDCHLLDAFWLDQQ